MSKRKLSTFEKEMQDPTFKVEFKQEYRQFLLSELILTLMEKELETDQNLTKK